MSKTKMLLIILLALSPGCARMGFMSREEKVGSGTIIVQQYPLQDFNALDVSNAFKVTVSRAGEYHVQVDIDDNLKEFVVVKVEGETLKLGMNGDYNYRVGEDSMKASITMPDMVALNMSGATRCVARGFKSDHDLRVDLSGASALTGSDLTAGRVKLKLSGASKIKGLTGSAKALDLRCSGASHANLGEFPVQKVEADISGASTARVSAAESLKGSASGASKLIYKGSPAVKAVTVSGASKVSRE